MKLKVFIIHKDIVMAIVFLLAVIMMTYAFFEYQLLTDVSRVSHNRLQVVRNGVKDRKIIALTFDDGPHPRFTPQILDLLDKYHVKATFFVLGKHVKAYPKVVQRLIKEGHEVGNHTFTHLDVTKASYRTVKAEFENTQNIIFSVTGTKPKIFRPPFGFLNTTTMNIAKEQECNIILWSPNEDPNDWNSPGVGKITHRVLSNIGNGNIILLHDYVEKSNSQTAEALKTILPELVKKGYQFVTISELIEISDLN